MNASQSRNDWPRESSNIDAMIGKIKDQEKIISALEDDLKDFLEDEFPSQEEMQEERVMTQQCNKAKLVNSTIYRLCFLTYCGSDSQNAIMNLSR